MLKKLLAISALFFASSSFAVDVNSASAADLDSIKGIGPSLSSAIIAERAKAPFKDWTDFQNRVKRVGKKNSSKFSSQGLTVDGKSYSPSASTNKKLPKKLDDHKSVTSQNPNQSAK